MEHAYGSDADFRMLEIVRDEDESTYNDSMDQHSFERGTRDYPRYMKESEDFSMGSNFNHPLSRGAMGTIEHPMAMNGWIEDQFNKYIAPVIPSVTKDAVQAAKEAAAKLAAQQAQNLLARPDVQTAITEQATTAALTQTAKAQLAAVSKVKEYWAKYGKMAMLAGGGLIGLYIVMKVIKKK